MKRFNYVLLLAVLFFLSGLTGGALADFPIVWETSMGTGNWGNDIVRSQLTPGGTSLMVFDSPFTSNAIVSSLNPQTGSIAWTKSVPISNAVLSAGGVDSSGNIYLGTGWGGYTVYKYDPTLTTPQWTYQNSSPSFEYVTGLITDGSGSAYASGFYGSGSGGGSTLVKVTSSGNYSPAWPVAVTNLNTANKDDYGTAMAQSSNNVVYRGGCDAGGGNPDAQGRVYGYLASNGAQVFNLALSEPDSIVTGLATDSSNNLYISYAFNEWNSSGGFTGQEQTVVEKVNSAGNELWKYDFNISGMYAGYGTSNALVLGSNGDFYLAFNQRLDGTEYPGLAELSSSGQLISMDTLNRPGWEVSGGIDAGANMVYMGIKNMNDPNYEVREVGMAVPEPSTLALLGVGGASLAACAWRRKRRAGHAGTNPNECHAPVWLAE